MIRKTLLKLTHTGQADAVADAGFENVAAGFGPVRAVVMPNAEVRRYLEARNEALVESILEAC